MSATAQGPLSARFLQHELGTREDEPASRLMRVLPNVPAVGLHLTSAPLLLAHRVTGYEVSLFVDAKYGAENRPWTGRPTWGRVRWTVSCDSCGKIASQSTQSNLVRPWTARCSCGARLYVETHEMPLLRWLDAETGEWRQSAERFGAR